MVTIPDSQRYPERLCLIKNELYYILVYDFENRINSMVFSLHK